MRSSTSTTGVSCFVQPGTARMIIEDSDSGGLRRVTEVTPTKVYFFADPTLSAEDLVYWVEPSGRAHWYKVLVVHEPCGANVVWTCECQETG